MKFLLLAASLFAVSCTGPREALTVKQFTLRNENTSKESEPMVRHEKLRRLYGAVSKEDRKARLGQYYSVLWNAAGTNGGEKRLIFRYQQGGSGSRIKTIIRDLPSADTNGAEEFTIIGDDYFQNGRVLTWKIDLNIGGKTIASKQSYLWE